MAERYDSTRFVNIYDKDFTFYFGGEPYLVKAGEERTFVTFISQHGAKHLLDLILQEKYRLPDSLADTPLRRELSAQILPDIAQKEEYKPMTDEEFKQHVLDELQKVKEEREKVGGRVQEIEAKIAELTPKPAAEVVPKRRGRPPKNP